MNSEKLYENIRTLQQMHGLKNRALEQALNIRFNVYANKMARLKKGDLNAFSVSDIARLINFYDCPPMRIFNEVFTKRKIK